ncbi:MAG: hypothetical protein QOG53_2563 [Frankiales bacterium]|jgi:hypothetical protein|nr:hypothetical protein [Frankiales bacterium]
MTQVLDRRERLARMIGPGASELSCADCFAELDRYVDAQFSGQDADIVVPFMAAHLLGCPACAEEHQALLDFLQESAEGQSS